MLKVLCCGAEELQVPKKEHFVTILDFFAFLFQKKELMPEKIFGNSNPVVLDIGFGMGDEIIDFSIKNPTKNVLGIEMYKPAIGNLLKNIYEKNIKNIKIIEYDAYCV